MADPDITISTTPHDAFGKDMLSDPLTAGPMLQHRLSPDISRALQWDTMKLESSSFVKHSLLQLHSDLLFSIMCGEEKVYLFLLLELQSTVDKFMLVRLLGYMYEMWADHIAKNPGGELPLPLLLPFVLHQGPGGWDVSVHFEDFFRLPKGMGPSMMDYIPKFQHGLLDLNKSDPMHEEENVRVRMILELMKRVRQKPESRKLLEYFAQLAELLLEHPQPWHIVQRMLTYVWTVDNTLDVEVVARTVERNPKLRNTVMTIAEQLMAKGKAEGAWIGKLQLLEHLMGLPETTNEALAGVEVMEVERRYRELQRKYDAQFKA